MKTVTVRDLRQRWPATEKALQVEPKILVTRDARPVAKLVRYVERETPHKCFDPVAHGKWQRAMSGGSVMRWVEEGLLKERDERRSARCISTAAVEDALGKPHCRRLDRLHLAAMVELGFPVS